MTTVSHGIRFRRGYTLADEAVSLIEHAPQTTESLSRQVLGLRSAPPAVAGQVLWELLGTDPRISVSQRGVWSLKPGDDQGDADARPLSAMSFAVVDVETTGGMAEGDGRICEFAAVHVDGGAITDTYGTLVNPGVPITRWVSRLTGISNGMLADAPDFAEISDEVRQRLEGRVFVAHNVGFDWRFVSAEMRRTRSLLPHGPRLCTVHLARRVIPGLSRRGLDSVAGYYGIAIDGRHRALGDAEATALALVQMLSGAEKQGVTSWGQLRRWLAGTPKTSTRARRRELLGGLPREEAPPTDEAPPC